MSRKTCNIRTIPCPAAGPAMPPPDLAIIGYGAFGQLAARHLRRHLRVGVCDPAARAGDLPNLSLAQAARCKVVVVAVPLAQLEDVLVAIAPHLASDAMVIDVASVKIRPAEMMLRLLPPRVQIVASHPLFGPASARDGLEGQRIAWCPLRGSGHRRAAALLRRLGLRVLPTTPERHDREMAVVQGLTHLIARSLGQLGPLPTALTTASFRRLAEAAALVEADSPELLRTILAENPHAAPIRRRFLEAAAAIAAG